MTDGTITPGRGLKTYFRGLDLRSALTLHLQRMKRILGHLLCLLLAASQPAATEAFAAQKANAKKTNASKANAKKPNAKNAQGKNKTPTRAEAQRDYNAAMNALREAQNALREAEKELENTRRRVTSRHLREAGVTAANARLKTAEATQAIIRKAVVNRIRERADHREATEAAHEAGRKLRELSRRDDLSAERKKELRAELSAIVRRPVEIEKAALAEDAGFQRAAKEAAAARSEAMAAYEKYRRLVAGDAELKKAAKAVEDARGKVAEAEKNLQASNRQLQAAIRAEAQKNRQQAAMKQNQRRKQNQKNKKKSGKKKKK